MASNSGPACLRGKLFMTTFILSYRSLLESQLAGDEVGDFVRKVEHHFGHEHVLQRHDCHRILHAVEALEGLKEVGEGCLEVLLLAGVQDAGLEVELCLDLRRDVDAVGGGPGASQGGSRLREVGESVVGLTLQQLHLHQQVLVVQLLQLLQQPGAVCERLLVSADVVVQTNQSRLQRLQ